MAAGIGSNWIRLCGAGGVCAVQVRTTTPLSSTGVDASGMAMRNGADAEVLPAAKRAAR